MDSSLGYVPPSHNVLLKSVQNFLSYTSNNQTKQPLHSGKNIASLREVNINISKKEASTDLQCWINRHYKPVYSALNT